MADIFKGTISIRDSAIYHIEEVAHYLVIEDLTIFGMKNVGIYLEGPNAGSRGSYVTVRNCIVTDCGGHGILFVFC